MSARRKKSAPHADAALRRRCYLALVRRLHVEVTAIVAGLDAHELPPALIDHHIAGLSELCRVLHLGCESILTATPAHVRESAERLERMTRAVVAKAVAEARAELVDERGQCRHLRITEVRVHEGSDREMLVGHRCLDCDSDVDPTLRGAVRP